ncbi:hypothetical protein [Leifsonia sp. P73]|uniref:hypothetical protein n=1 Tax=Leifsonia sp. P73 TaxID=3423959 RepID=UPI003DA20526
MFRHRPLATVATALAALLLGTVALSGCSSSSSPLAVGATIPAGKHPVVAIVGDSIESGMGLEPFEAWPALVAVDRRWGLQNFSEPGAASSPSAPPTPTSTARSTRPSPRRRTWC